MDWIQTIGATAIGVAATWFFARHYYLKTVGSRTFVHTLVQAAKHEIRSEGHPENDQPRLPRSTAPISHEDDEQKMCLDAPNIWIRSLVEAYERGAVSPAEIMMAGHVLRKAGQLIGNAVEAIYADVNREPIPVTTSPQWSNRVMEGWRKHMAELGDKLRRKG